MRLIRSIREWRELRRDLKGDLGFVPTMGALHEGHLELGRMSVARDDQTLFSIFVNPTQFNDPGDFEKYPRALERDAGLLERIGVDFVLAPEFPEMYPDRYRYSVEEGELSKILCGAHRPGHFKGMLTVVMKLLNIAGARRAYFGEKDFQQLELVRGMVESFFLDVEIVAAPIVREKDGLAMSSRNLRLTPEARAVAPVFHRELGSGKPPREVRAELERHGFDVEYIEEYAGHRIGAVRLGDVRLIDNVRA